jgi:O-antigen ligase
MKLSIYQHPSYLALFTLLSTFIAFDAGFVNDISRKAKAAWITAGVMLLISVFFLSSRAAILAAIVSMPLYFFRLSRRGTATKTILAGSLVFILLAVSLAVTNPRVSSTIRSVAGSQTGNTSLPEGRLLIWSAVTEIITENMVLGVGTGDLQDELNKRYVEIGKTDFARDNFNTHNQFIEILAENGIIGLSIFLLIFLNLLYISVREWNLILVMFIIIVFISFMFETMLNRLAGVSFFAYFSLILPNSGNSAGSNP